MDIKSLVGAWRNGLAAVFAVSLLFLVGACGKSDEATVENGKTERVVRIGHAGPLTGPDPILAIIPS